MARSKVVRMFLVIVTVLLCKITLGETKVFQIFERNSSIDNNVCFPTEVVFTSTCLSSSHCLWSSLQSTCMSAFYHTDSGECTGCGWAYVRADDVSENTGTWYYELKRKLYGETCQSGDICIGTNGACWEGTCKCVIGYSFDQNRHRCVIRLYGETCQSGDTCIGTNGACWEGTCKCVMGYSFDPKTQTCVEHCDSYGTTFQEYLGYRLLDLNDGTLHPSTIAECEQMCVDTTSCLVFEYRQSDLMCHTTSATPLTHPDSLEVYSLMNLYMRNCEE